MWRQKFEDITKVPDEPSYPAALFIKHDDKVPVGDAQKLQSLENQAGKSSDYAGIYHVSLEEPDDIFKSFVEFAQLIKMKQTQFQRTSTDAYLDQDNTIKIGAKKSGGAGLSNRGKDEKNANGNGKDVDFFDQSPEDRLQQ